MAPVTKKRPARTEEPLTGIPGVLAALHKEIRYCRVCPTMKPHRKGPRRASRGNRDTGYFLATSSPQPVPLLEQALEALNDERFRKLPDLFYIVHAVRCVPTRPDDKQRARAPAPAECRACHSFIDFETRLLHPRLIVAVGAPAARSLLGEDFRITRDHGVRQVLPHTRVIPLIEPSPRSSAALRRKGLTLQRYKSWLTGFFGSLVDTL